MNCEHCGEELERNSIFCSKCGSKVEKSELKENISQKMDDTEQKNTNESLTKDTSKQTTLTKEKKISKFTPKLQLFIPLISFLVVATILTFFYFSEQSKNTSVLELQKSAEDAALEGQYSRYEGTPSPEVTVPICRVP